MIAALEAAGGSGVFDRLIADGYSREGLEVLTLDRKMANLADVRRLQAKLSAPQDSLAHRSPDQDIRSHRVE